MGSAITGDACAASGAGVSGHSSASSGSGATYIDHNTSRLLGETECYRETSIRAVTCVIAPLLQVDGVEALKSL